ncbi:MAG: cytochrome c biogenesis protein ResB [Nitrospirae bacterium]|nr:cytochrome c biogenesis protein ResB [Nitrospirota bacterium]
MKILKTILGFFISLRTAIWLLIGLICLLLFGSLVMPNHEEFLALHTVALFDWMQEMPMSIAWWLWACLAVLSLLTANTLVCSVESLARKRESRQWLLIISPQVMHIGFLFILLAHLLSSYGSFKGITYAYQGSVFQLPNNLEVRFNKVNADVDAAGYVKDWSADIEYFKDGKTLSHDRILPNSPSFKEGLGIYIKTMKVAPFPVAMIEVSREPGAPWALVGGIFFMAGMVTLLFLKIRQEDPMNPDSKD